MIYTKGREMNIFLSYSHLDNHIAEELESRLTAKGLNCFMAERTLQGGDDWLIKIREGIKNSEKVFILITPRSVNSAWIHLETGAAWMENKDIYPLLQFVNPSDLTAIIKTRHATIIETEMQKTNFIASLTTSDGHRAPRQMTMNLVLEKISSAKAEMNRHTFDPNLFIGSGKGGALCAAVFASQLGHHPLKVVDCQFAGTGDERNTKIDDSSLRREDIFGKNVLVVEWARKSGRTYELIENKIAPMKPAILRAYALFWTQESQSVPHYYGETCTEIPQNPWGTY